MNRKTATAQWQGNLKDGDGEIRFGREFLELFAKIELYRADTL